MSTITHKSFTVNSKGLVARDWDGMSDTNNDGKLSFKEDAWKNYEITPAGITYYNRDGTANVAVTVDGPHLY